MMRARVLVVLIVTLTAGVSAAVSPAAAGPPPPIDDYRPVRGPAAPAEFRYQQKTVRGEALPRHAYANAADAARRLPTAGGDWTLIGPTNIGGRITSLALNDLVIGPAFTLYIATDQGVFVSHTGGFAWRRLSRGMPLVPVDDIEYDHSNHRLVAATFGRGLYEIRVP
jgi:hypothetical protein